MIDGHDNASTQPAEQRTTPREPMALPEASRWAAAALSVGAGAIHLAMTPSHLAESGVEGTGFLVAAWLQFGLAAAIVRRPSRLVLWSTVVVNLSLIGAWIVSRTAGLPLGAHSGHAEDASFVDVTCVALEAAIIVVALVALTRPVGAAFRAAAPSYALSFAALALATAAIASPAARNHAASSHGDHEAAGHDHSAAGDNSTMGDDSAADGGHAAADDHSDTGDHHDHTATATPEADDNGLAMLTNGHQHGSGEVELDAATQRRLDKQLAQTQQLIDRYPTVADAEAAGYRRAGPFMPGLGTHFLGTEYHPVSDGVVNRDDMPFPLLIFDGHAPTSPLAGFMYMSTGADEPKGFVGPNDHWHYHEKVCVVFKDGLIETPFGADVEGVTEKMCTKVGGNWMDNTGYMVHVWTVPGYENERGVFAEINPALACPDDTYITVPMSALGTRLTACAG